MRYSACIELLFAASAGLCRSDPGRQGGRARRGGVLEVLQQGRRRGARGAGRDGAAAGGDPLRADCATGQSEAHAGFLEGVRTSLAAALKLGAQVMIAQAGDDQHGVARARQHAEIVKVLEDAAEIIEGTGMTLALSR